MAKKEKEVEIYDIDMEKDKSKKYLKLFEKARNFNSSRMESYAENMAFFQGNQHLLSRYKTEQPWIVNMNTPYAKVAIENRLSSLWANDYEGELLPLSKDDVEPVEILNELYKREWRRLDIDKYIRDCTAKGAVVREAYIHIYVDKDETVGGKNNKRLGALKVKTYEPSAVFIDPTVRNFRNANYIFIAGRIQKDIAMDKYPKLRAFETSGSSMSPSERGEIYYDNDYSTQQEDVWTELTYYGKTKGKVKRVTLINGIIVNEKELSLKQIPIAQFRWIKAAQSCYGLSLMDDLLSLQKAICSIESAITNTAIAYAAPSLMVRKGCGIDPKVLAKTNGAPGVVYAINGDLDNAIKPVTPPRINQDILNIKTDYELKIKEISGNTNQFLGDIGTAGNTSNGTELAIERAKVIEINITNNIAEFVEDITNILIEYIITLYSGQLLTAYDGKNEDGNYEFTEFQVPEEEVFKDMSYKYYIELDKKTPYSKQAQKKELMDLFQMERQYDTPIKTITVADIVRNSDIENKDEILRRFNTLSKQDAQEKAETIEELIAISNEQGIDQELVTAAISEVIASAEETPALDQLLDTIEQNFEAQLQQQEQMMAEQEQMAQMQQQAQANTLQNSGINASPDAINAAQQIMNGEIAPEDVMM